MASLTPTITFEIRLSKLAYVELWFWELLTHFGFKPTQEACDNFAKRHVRIKEIGSEK